MGGEERREERREGKGKGRGREGKGGGGGRGVVYVQLSVRVLVCMYGCTGFSILSVIWHWQVGTDGLHVDTFGIKTDIL